MTTTRDHIAGRTARCSSCGRTRASDGDGLAFFEYRGPGSRDARDSCVHCRYSECAHDPAHMETLVHGRDGKRRATVVEDGRCPGFENNLNGREFDSFYCGCRGWD